MFAQKEALFPLVYFYHRCSSKKLFVGLFGDRQMMIIFQLLPQTTKKVNDTN